MCHLFLALLLRENKNRYFLAFLKSLVDCGLFEHIYLNFLPVGHTHCDIGQLFSRIAVWMRGRKPCNKFLESNSPKLTLRFMFMLTFCSTPSVHMGWAGCSDQASVQRSDTGVHSTETDKLEWINSPFCKMLLKHKVRLFQPGTPPVLAL